MDVNSSIEELSQEERLMLSSSKRQEPQGEEHDVKNGGEKRTLKDSSSSPSSSTSSVFGDFEMDDGPHKSHFPSSGSYNPRGNNMSLDSNHSAYNTLIIHQNNSSLLADTWIPASHEFASFGMGASPEVERQNSQPHHHQSHLSYSLEPNNTAVTSSELSVIPKDYLDQLTVLKHLAKEVQNDPMSGSPGMNPLLHSSSFSKSQPDLSAGFGDGGAMGSSSDPYGRRREVGRYTEAEEVLPSVQILEILMRENSNLKVELANARRRIHTIHKLESELSKLQASHVALFESSERRESLERTARVKLSTEVKRLTAVNRELLCTSNSLQNLSPFAANSDVEYLKKELSKRDIVHAQLLSQNKELMSTKERQEIELAAQRATLAEQRTHIEILDTALTNAQNNVMKLEDEAMKRQAYGEKVSQLQRTLTSLQMNNEKREASEGKIRAELESEIRDLKVQIAKATSGRSGSYPKLQPPPYPGQSSSQKNEEEPTSSEMKNLQAKLRLSEEKITCLDRTVGRWEQWFGAEAKQSTSSPNTPNSWSSRGETPQHFFSGEEPSMSTRTNDLEWKIKDLESRLVEKDAMIQVLNSRSSARASPFYPPSYRESPSYKDTGKSGEDLLYAKAKCESEPPPNYANLPLKLRLGGSGSSLVKNSNESLISANGGSRGHGNSGPGSVSSTSSTGNGRSIDEQLKDLDHQLLSKEAGVAGSVGGLKIHAGSGSALCCIPGLSHPGASARKGKIPHPLLEGLSGGGGGKKGNLVYALGTGASDRTSSGPPFSSADIICRRPFALSSSVDNMMVKNLAGPRFVPFSPLHPKGLPPKSPGSSDQTGNVRSLERKDNLKDPFSYPSGKTYDAGRCKSLDRREFLKEKKSAEKKSGVVSKAAFFGGLLRRSPSPAKGNRDHGSGEKYTLLPPSPPVASNTEEEVDRATATLLDNAGRSSQRSRNLRPQLAVLEETGKEWEGRGGTPLPHRRNSTGFRMADDLKKVSFSPKVEEKGQKWGKIVKTPFGLRYTLGNQEKP